MEKQILCIIKDMKSGEVFRPSPCPNSETARRMFFDAILTSENTVLHSHPEDFVLLNIGSYNPITGEVIGRAVCEFEIIANGSEVNTHEE